MIENISILGCGWLGLPLAKSLVQDGYKVKGSTTTESKLDKITASGATAFLIDLHKKEEIQDFLNTDVLIVSIVIKDIAILNRLVKHVEASNIKKVIYISSTGIYPFTNGTITEESLIKDGTVAQKEQLFTENKNFTTTVIRFGGLFGGERKPGNFFPDGATIKNPDGFINLIHLDDCIGIIERILEKEIWGEVYNACTDSHPKRRDFYSHEMMKLGRKEPTFDEETPSQYKIISNEKLKKQLNYNFKYPDLMSYE